MIDRKPYKGFPGYEITSDGVWWSCWSNSGKMTDKWHKLIGRVGQRGYHYVTLSKKERQNKKTVKTHQAVAKTFVPKVKGKPWTLHSNGNSIDNRASNLYWGDNSDNQKDSIRHGTAVCLRQEGTKNPINKYHPTKIKVIRYLAEFGNTHQRIADLMRMERRYVGEIITRRVWKHI